VRTELVWRAALLGGMLLGVALVCTAPASAQDDPVADRVLWPSWSQSLAALGLGSQPTPLALWVRPEPPAPRARCVAAEALGTTAGLLADALRSEPVNWPAGFDYFPARSWRSLPKLGAALGGAVACPPPLTRTPAPVMPPGV
jgi:hypothetical protein